MSWHPLTTSDPIPGEPWRMRSGGQHYTRVADSISSARDALQEIVDGTAAVSDAVDKLGEQAAKVRENIGKAHARYKAVGAALTTYAEAHQAAQDAAEALRSRAVTKQQEVDDAVQERAAAQTAYDNAVDDRDANGTPIPPAVSQRLTNARSAVTARRSELQGIIDELPGVVSVWRSAASTAATAVRDSEKLDKLNDSWWQDNVVPVLEKVADIAADVAFYVGIAALVLAWVPGLGQLLAAVALIAGVVSLAANAALVMGGDRHWSEAAWAALAIIPFGIGKVGSKLGSKFLKGATGRTAKKAARKAAKSAARPMSRGNNPRMTKAQKKAIEKSLMPKRSGLTDYKLRVRDLGSKATYQRIGRDMAAGAREGWALNNRSKALYFLGGARNEALALHAMANPAMLPRTSNLVTQGTLLVQVTGLGIVTEKFHEKNVGRDLLFPEPAPASERLNLTSPGG